MARNLTASGGSDTEEAPEGATLSVKDRQERIRKAHKALSDIEAQIEGHQATMKGLRKSIADTYRKIKSDLGIKREDFEFTRRLIELEDDDRSETEDSIRECYEALRPGEQLDWLKATEGKSRSVADGKPPTTTLQ